MTTTAESECYAGPVDPQPCPVCGEPMTYVYGDRCEACFEKMRALPDLDLDELERLERA